MSRVKLIFLIRGTNIYSTHWECVAAYENEEEANRIAECMTEETPDMRFAVIQFPYFPVTR